MKKGQSKYQKLKAWCADNGVDYRTAYMYMNRNKVGQDETIAYYARPPAVTMLQMCIDADLNYDDVLSYKSRHGLSNEEAISNYAEMQRSKGKLKSKARTLADQHGIPAEKIYKHMHYNRCGPERAIKEVLEYERQKSDDKNNKGLPKMLTRAWV
mgnify:CR=1 FL=1